MNQTIWVLLLALQGVAAVIHVPEDQPTVQLGLDATTSGDTVLVARGTYQELLTSPDHSFTLCSNFPFTQDSTDIVETVLDGNHDGTILYILLNDGESASVQGLTIWRGMGQDFGGAYHLSAGAINLATVLGEERVIDLEVSSCVFRENYSENGASILYVGGDAGWPTYGRLVLSQLHFLGNVDPEDSIYESAIIRTHESPDALLEDWVLEAGESSNDLLSAHITGNTIIRNITILDGNGGDFQPHVFHSVGQEVLFENIRSIASEGRLGTQVHLVIAGISDESQEDVCTIRNIEVDGTGWGGLFIQGSANGPRLDIDGLHLHNITGPGVLGGSGNGLRGVMRNLHVHHNTVGDSISLFGSIVSFGGVDIYNAHIHDNTVIIPPHPNPGGTGAGGNYLDGPILWTSSSYLGEPLHFENITLENNTVIDLDDYSDPFPEHAYRENIAREFHFVLDWDDTTYIKDIVIRNSQQPNHCPEIYVPESIEQSFPGWTMGRYARFLVAENVLLENCDDGGFLAGGQSVSLDNVVLKNVGRVGLLMGNGHAKNVLIDGTVAKDNWLHLTPGHENLTMQAALIGSNNSCVFENLTITNCDSLRALIQEDWAGGSEAFVFRNAVIAGNQYDYLFEDIDASRITWDHCYVQEAVPGEGNIIGQDPMYDTELGPPFLSPESPCVDAGNPESVYNDVEDADNPGWARWPSQGGLRNDMGFFGGPGVDSLAVDWLPVRPHEKVVQPQNFALGDPYPNPFNPVCRIPFSLERPSKVTLRLYNMAGQLVKKQGTSLFGETWYSAGRHELLLDGGRLPSGVYFAEVRAGALREVVKVLLVR